MHPAMSETKDTISNNGNPDLWAAGSDSYNQGHFAGYGYPTFVYKEEEECDTGINPVLALSTLGILAGATLFIFRRITNSMGRRKRRSSDGEGDQAGGRVLDMVASGLFLILFIAFLYL